MKSTTIARVRAARIIKESVKKIYEYLENLEDFLNISWDDIGTVYVALRSVEKFKFDWTPEIMDLVSDNAKLPDTVLNRILNRILAELNGLTTKTAEQEEFEQLCEANIRFFTASF